MWIVGLAVGFRPEGGLAGNAAGIGIMLLFGFALSWVGVAAGAAVPHAGGAAGIIFAVVFPLTFVSSAFVPIDTLPEWMQPFAENQPMTVVVNAVRDLTLGLTRHVHGAGDPLVGGHPGGRLPAGDLALQPAHDTVGTGWTGADRRARAGAGPRGQTCGSRPSRLKTTNRTASTIVRRKSVRSIPRRLR